LEIDIFIIVQINKTLTTNEGFMKQKNIFLLIGCIIAALLLWGCSTSEESEKDQTVPPPPPARTEKKAEPAPAQNQEAARDTLRVETNTEVANPPKKETETVPPPVTVSHEMPKANFSVQIGAFSMPDKADQWASLARSRFGKGVYTLKDEKTGNTKVLVGEFGIKDEARKFRDQIVQQFPDDYRDAWVFDVPQH
jgi:cell division septation protein DedD